MPKIVSLLMEWICFNIQTIVNNIAHKETFRYSVHDLRILRIFTGHCCHENISHLLLVLNISMIIVISFSV